MTDMILEVAAYLCLALGVALLVARLAGERIQRAAHVLRFRLSLRRLDSVPTEWTKAMKAMDELRDEPARNRQVHRRHQHPSTPDER